ncbi:phosphoribosylamine--glycine ligase [Prochlorococcus marinus]|uniref:Phosphoribosylamine--glycine ligase n=1 Tax=Prochlorococcus marinus XMU1408 TaxID=2213228 RepID=A0A318R2Z9_PROMR|nr:phosphoribosylamine--glycine ligase [Prochlorococcus marinus]MBW3042524.1 phosphoribosylamine--glycine ligase [Prochlorococcus marinus str. XMU1408]PYE01250.1 phosphoribosylamine--glycine ligase [Prochlorococcus marinus XMU1408]
MTKNPNHKGLNQLKRILIIGGGGRENSIAWALSKNQSIHQIYVCPGNGGTANFEKCICLQLKDEKTIILECNRLQIDLVIIGPEDPLAKGLANKLREAGLIVFGPCKEGAQLEASKDWAKTLMIENNIPTAKYWSTNSRVEALEILHRFNQPLVIKADGLAAGKGVTVCETIEQSKKAINDVFSGKFGSAGNKIILEEKIEGPEVSIFALCDGEKLIVLPPAQDHKRLLEGDNGPNTGGMGAYAPALLINQKDIQDLTELILIPTLKGLKKKKIRYIGVIYAGLMITSSGPKVIEFNCRFGDPECQALMPLMGEEFASVLFACARGELEKAPKLTFHDVCSACVVAASKGYPENTKKGDRININIESNQSIQVFHAGTTIDEFDNIITNGGRVLSVVAQGESFDKAFQLAYSNLDKINFDGMHFRKDIGYQVRNIKI